MTLAAASALVMSALVAAAPTDSRRTRPVVSLSASPARVALEGDRRVPISLANVGRTRVRVAAAAARFALDLRGRPMFAGPAAVRRSAAAWLSIRPHNLSVGPGATGVVEVASRVPPRAEPGDYHALVLLATNPSHEGRVGVRMRLGVRVVVRVPGMIVRRLAITRLRVRRAGRARTLELTLANRGNVTEALPPGRVRITLAARGRVQVVRPERRELLPGARGILAARYRGQLRGVVLARVAVRGAPSRAFRLRL